MPKHRAMYNSFAGSAARSLTALEPSFGAVLTTFVPPKAKSRNKKVPTNSPEHATICPLITGGRELMIGTRLDTVVSFSSGSCACRLLNGFRMPLAGRSTFMVADRETSERS